MKLDRCKNGHIYDTSRYSDCPYCKSEGLVSVVNEENINLVEQMNDDEKTVAYWAKEARVDPVVG
ncbi:MAG: FHA domain-containing protein, partial [Leptotrichiaceae bacterium]